MNGSDPAIKVEKAVAEKALGLVDAKNVGLKRYVEEQAKKYGAEPKGDEKKDK